MNGTNGRMADITLNEITSNQQSNITGYIEVAGNKADVIIVNPNGIMVSGGGFINTARLSMITGSSLQNGSSLDANGNLNPFKLSTEPNAVINVIGRNITNEKGDIVGYNIGIDAQNTGYLTLISRVANISGDIIGNTDTAVEVKTGNDKAVLDKTTGEFDVEIDNSNIYGGNINIKSDNLINKNSSVIYGIEETHIEATKDINNTSKIYANDLVKLKSNTISNTGGEITANNDIDIELISNFITGGLIGSTYGTTTITTENIIIDNGTKKAKDNDGNDIEGTEIKTELTGYNIVLKSRNDITNTAISTLVAGNDIIFDATLAVYNHNTISTGNNLSITADRQIINNAIYSSSW